MTPVAWLLAAAGILMAGLFYACWWGSNGIFSPGHRALITVFPDRFAMPYETISCETNDGLTLRGWLIPANKPTDRTVMLCHGWSDNKGDMLDRFRFLHEDFNLMAFDSRYHGDSDGERTTIGTMESLDFDAALQALRRKRPAWCKRLGLFGLSMGGAMSILGMAKHHEPRCAVIEAPFRSFNAVVDQFTKNNYNLPYFPFVWLTLIIIRARLGTDPEPYSPIYHVHRLKSRPLLFIAGELDRLAPLDGVRALYEAAGDPKELWVIPEATHSKCQETAGAEYARRITDFFEKNL